MIELKLNSNAASCNKSPWHITEKAPHPCWNILHLFPITR